MTGKIKIKQPVTLIIITCLVVFMLGAIFRLKSPNSIDELKKKNIEGFFILTISTVIKAGFWKIDLKNAKPEMIAKNSMNMFKKGEKNQKRYTDPNLSPNNQILAYTLEFNGKKSVGLMTIDGLKEVPFVELEDESIYNPTFSPDGKTIAMISNDKIYITPYPPIKNIELQSITQKEVSSNSLSWYSNNLIGYINKENIFKIVDIETAKTKPFIKAKQAAFSPDSNFLAISTGKKLVIYSLQKARKTFEKNGTPFNTIKIRTLGQLTWSSDSSYILTSISEKSFSEKQNQTALIDIKTGEIIYLPKSWKDSLSHAWSKPVSN